MTRMHRCVVLALCAASLISEGAWSASASPDAQDRDRQRAAIVAGRSETNARFGAQRKICQAQFAVSTCMSDALKAQRVALHDLRQRELTLNEAERREAAALREQAVAAKAAKSSASQAHPDDTGPSKPEHVRAPPKPNPLIHKKALPADPQAIEEAQAARRTKEARSEADYAAKARAVAEHREAVLRRNAERAAGGKVAAPLPKAASEP